MRRFLQQDDAAGMCQKHARLKNGTALISAAYKQLSGKIV
jgi:hypothetical protein